MATSQPSNASEWQLYNVLKRANLLQYYDTFIAQGGDDVQQLCEAGEDEFLEIMALVGMAAKPLHVRRLQKALQEWVANPAALEANGQTLPTSAGFPLVPITGPAPGSISAVVRDSVNVQVHSTQTTPAVVSATTWTPQATSRSESPSDSVPSPSSGSAGREGKEDQDRGGSPMMQPVLLEAQIGAIAMAAASLTTKLPGFEPKDLNSKKPVNREIQNLISSADSSSNRLEELRKYAAIYGRFDSKRKNDRPMSLHEISVNEAAAQLCLHCPALLTRREELFPLARQVVRDSGYQYSKGHSRAADVVTTKKGRLDPTFQRHFDASFKNVKQEIDKDTQEERMSAVAQELASIRQHQEQVRAELAIAREEQDFLLTQKLQSELASLTTQQLQVLQEHSDVLRRPRRQHRATGSRPNNGDDTFGDNASASSSPISDSDSLNNLATATLDSLYAAFRNSNGTLFEEGLRIAQQYGMADFARELKELQSLNQGPSDNGSGGGTSSVKELDQPFELKEVKPEMDSGLGDDSLDGLALAVGSGAVNLDKGKNSNLLAQAFGGPSSVGVENGADILDASPRSNTSSPGKSKGDKSDLKRKGDNLETVPSRPPSRRSRSSQSGAVYSGVA